MVQFSHPYMTIGKNIGLTGQIFVSIVMSLHFNTQSKFVIAFLPRSKLFFFFFFLISWLQSPTAVLWEPKKIKSVIVSIISPSICYDLMGTDAVILVF